jgi:UDP-glucose 4-epimerase
VSEKLEGRLNLLVTGGAGYIGSVVCSQLLAEKHEVVVYDSLSRGHRDSVPKEAQLVIGDVSDRKALDQVFKSRAFDGVLHLAALIEAGESMRVPELYFRANSAATLTLLEAMLAAGVDKFVFSSTAALYGEPENIPIRESDTLKPTNVYGESKLLVERVLDWLNRIHGFRYASLRYFNAAGATKTLGERHNHESHLIPLVLQAAVGQRPSISIFGTDYSTPDGTCIRDYVHVLDLARAHILALEALVSHDKLIYNLGNGRGFSVREVIQVAERVTKKRIPVVEAPRRPGDPAILIASSEKIQQELHWKPQHPDLEDIVASAWNYLQFSKP